MHQNLCRRVLVKNTPPSKPRIHKRRDPETPVAKSRSSGDGSSYTNKTYASMDEENLYQTVEMTTMPKPKHLEPRTKVEHPEPRTKRSSRSRDYTTTVEYSLPRKPEAYENNRYDNTWSSQESSGATKVHYTAEPQPLPPSNSPRLMRSRDVREEATVPVTHPRPNQSGPKIYIESDESDLNQTDRYFPY